MTRKITIERNETNHQIEHIYATIFDNGLIEVRRNVRHKLSGNENDMPDNRLTIEQHKRLLELATDTHYHNFKTQIAVIWSVEDVQSLDDSLTDEQAMKVLEFAKNKHDAEIGINWDVLQIHLDYLKDEGEL